jgi:tRNA pseudouridine38-40 synthase
MRIAMGIEYDGSDFCGWQRQRSGRTVQGCLEQAVASVANHDLSVVCAGRTDTGVHATAQVVHFDTPAMRSPRSWILGSNANLPADIRVQWAQPVDEAFHARFEARRRHYRYVILNRDHASAVLRKRVCWEYADLDVCRMREAATHLVGEHDFTSFRAVACQAKSPVRTVYQLDITRQWPFVYLDISANAYLHHMVRCIAGVLLSIGRGDRSPGWSQEILRARDRTLGGVTAPAGGLYLVAVKYPNRYAVPDRGWLPAYAN